MEEKMKVLVVGGTRFFGIHMVKELLKNGHEVTIATRGNAKDEFGHKVQRLVLERTDACSMQEVLKNLHFDVIIDKIGYCSNDIKNIMEVTDCDRYIYMSTTSVYDSKHMDTREEEFDGINKKLVWCNRSDFPYDEIKRQAECALWQEYSGKNWIAVRYPFVIGKDDYTKRMLFYIENTIKGVPMNIDNLDYQMGYIRSDEAGKFMAFLVDVDFTGAVNGSSHGTISLKKIIEYVEKKTGKKAIIDQTGIEAPYNGEPEYSINVSLAEKLGFHFSELNDWIYELIDYYIELVEKTKGSM